MKKYRFANEINKKYPQITVLYLENDTRGAAETLYLGTKNIRNANNEPVIVLDGDTFYNIDILKIYRECASKNAVVCFKQLDENPIYSYIKFNDKNKILKIAEKKKISSYANTGTYAFLNIHQLKKYCKHIIDNNQRDANEFYTSVVIRSMLEKDIPFESIVVEESDFEVLGTPEQLQIFQRKFLDNPPVDYFKKYRICFDFDNTLVTYPTVTADYSTVKPIQQNIDYLNFLKSLGCTIIIYTARRMKTHGGNVGKILKDVGAVTLNTLDKFNIEYDEIYFGKPYAHTYIDDLVVNAHDDFKKYLGISDVNIAPRDFNTIQQTNIDVIKKTSNGTGKMKAEINWYQHIPDNIKKYTPNLITYDTEKYTSYTLEKITGVTYQELFLNQSLRAGDLVKLLDALQSIHSVEIKETDIDIYDCYYRKIISRYNSNYNYKQHRNSPTIFKELCTWSKKYESNNEGRLGIIHGDPVFTNILYEQNKAIKFIDPRGLQGDNITIYGDIFYDYAKVYQSLIGYDETMQNVTLPVVYKDELLHVFEDYINDKYNVQVMDNVRKICNSLLFTLLPLHNNELCSKYYSLIKT